VPSLAQGRIIERAAAWVNSSFAAGNPAEREFTYNRIEEDVSWTSY